MKPKKQITTKWSSKFAYALGLLVADGSLSKDGRHFDFTSKDEDLVKLFINCLILKNNKIGRKTSGYTRRKDYFRIQFSDVNFFEWCLGFGLKPNKSKSLTSLKVPSDYFFDFLRGCFDGDGSIYAYWDPRWKSSYMFYLSFTSASLPFLCWLQKIIKQDEDIRGGKITASTRCYQLRYAKSDTIHLIDKMFHSKNIPCLKRKFVKIRKILKINEDHNNIRAGDEIGKHASLRG